MNKHSSLLRALVDYGNKKFYNNDAWTDKNGFLVIKNELVTG